MRVIVNDKEIVFPSSLSEFTLGQRISFQQEHGDLLDKMLDSILAMEDELDREIEMIEYSAEKMFRTFAFFAGCTVEAIKEAKFVDDVANVYYSCCAVLFHEEEHLELKKEFIWKDEVWVLGDPEIKQGDKRTFGELIDAKSIMKDLKDLGQSRWEAMLRLCAIYLRKKNELYREQFVWEGSERMELMKQLPMDIVLQVGFFLSGTINFYLSTLTSSANQGSKAAVHM